MGSRNQVGRAVTVPSSSGRAAWSPSAFDRDDDVEIAEIFAASRSCRNDRGDAHSAHV
jgi:hypothetical protein